MGTTAPGSVGYNYVPGTKVVGFVEFDESSPAVANSTAHGARAASAAAGNLFGTCPECLVVFVHNDGTDAPVEWAMSQPWIDVVTNSYAYAEPSTGTSADRHFSYTGCDTDLQREAAERGQATFWSASNGLVSGRAPGSTWQSCQFGPDWAFTVGGIAPSGSSQFWAGKPVDLAAPIQDYPTQDGSTINGTGTMGGTSVATPVAGGSYARALWTARQALDGPSRIQEGGIVARGAPVDCGSLRPDCELGDGMLTGEEMRTRFLHGAEHTPEGTQARPEPPEREPANAEEEFLAEGHGSYWGRFQGEDTWYAEHARITAPMLGQAPAPERPEGEADWFTVDSWCRQQIWGAWEGGYYVEGESQLPGPDPMWPTQSAYEVSCPDEILPMADGVP